MGTGKQQAITITGHSGLDDNEIDNMVKDAETHADEDKMRRELIDTKNQADQMVYTLEKLMRENKDKISEDEAKTIQEEIDKTKKAIATDDVEEIKKATESLSQASHKLSEMMYQQAAQQTQQQASESQEEASSPQGNDKTSEKDEEEVIDAEVVDDDKK
jgi:molecular chaperone DnaK